MGSPFAVVAFFVVSLFFGGAGTVWGQDLSIEIEGETFSAHLRESPLGVVTEKIENETGIWFKAGEALLQEKISVVFDELPFEDGLGRILSKVNYSLVFDDDDEIVGVFLFSSLDPSQKQVIERARAGSFRQRPLPSRRTLPPRRPQSFRN